MRLDNDQLKALGRLARLPVPDASRAELARVVSLLDALAQAPVDGLKPLAHPHDTALRLRPDEVTGADLRDALLALAPETQGGYYLVPRVIE